MTIKLTDEERQTVYYWIGGFTNGWDMREAAHGDPQSLRRSLIAAAKERGSGAVNFDRVIARLREIVKRPDEPPVETPAQAMRGSL